MTENFMDFINNIKKFAFDFNISYDFILEWKQTNFLNFIKPDSDKF